MKANRVFWEGMVYDDKIIKEVFRNCAKTEYFLRFTDGSYKVVDTRQPRLRNRPIFDYNNLDLK